VVCFHIAGQTFFQLARFLVFPVAANQPDKRIGVGCSAYQRLDNLHEALGINVAYAVAQTNAAHHQNPVHLRQSISLRIWVLRTLR
jgi:hypothetical protein